MRLKKYRSFIILTVLIVGMLMLLMSIGFRLGFLSNNPDGLERVLIDQKGEYWVENLTSPYVPLLNWISNDYVAGIIGVVLTLGIIMSVFYTLKRVKKKNNLKKTLD
ncbi:MAG: hypothetical protein ACXAAI_00725 [Promethearchaeota archaeon]|jgi:hypothetical protein